MSQVTDFEHPLRPIDDNHYNNLRANFLDEKLGLRSPQNMSPILGELLCF